MVKLANSNPNEDVGAKLNVLISLNLRLLLGDKEFAVQGSRRKNAPGVIQYLADMGLKAQDISQIVGSPVTSVRTLLTPKRRKKVLKLDHFLVSKVCYNYLLGLPKSLLASSIISLRQEEVAARSLSKWSNQLVC